MWQFQSTPSARRATFFQRVRHPGLSDFNPRPPRGGRRGLRLHTGLYGPISIHALREEGDNKKPESCSWAGDFNPRPPRGGRQTESLKACPALRFQSTPSARRATLFRIIREKAKIYFNPRPPRGGRHEVLKHYGYKPEISIHALREEGDQRVINVTADQNNFNPRPPRGGRHRRPAEPRRPCYFNPRPPRGGRLLVIHFGHCANAFQSTPSARRATGRPSAVAAPLAYFNPRPPRGGRPPRGCPTAGGDLFQSTPSARRATFKSYRCTVCGFYFNPRPPRGGRLDGRFARINAQNISIHALREEGDSSEIA